MDQASRALKLLEKGKHANIRQTALATGVPQSTIRDRARGVPPLSQRTTKLNRLTGYQEAILVAYI